MGNIMKDLIGTGQYMQFVYEMTYKYVWRFYYFVVFLLCTSTTRSGAFEVKQYFEYFCITLNDNKPRAIRIRIKDFIE